MQYDTKYEYVYSYIISEQVVRKTKKRNILSITTLVNIAAYTARARVHGTRPVPVPTKPAGTMADESTENVHRFARKSPDTLLRLACDTHSFYKKLKNVSCEYDRLNG